VEEQTTFSVDDARAAAARDELGAWVAAFLASPGSDNAALAHELTEPPRSWLGPVLVPLHDLHRLAGPPDHPVLCPVDDDYWDDRVDDLEDRIDDGWEPPPLIVTFRDGRLVLEDGNHRVEGLRRAGEGKGWAVIGFEGRGQLDRVAGAVVDEA
jgi:hypothetical protein